MLSDSVGKTMKEKKRKKNSQGALFFSSLLNSCSCMQMPPNMLRIYPVEALPGLKAHSFVLFKSLWLRMRRRGGARMGRKRG